LGFSFSQKEFFRSRQTFSAGQLDNFYSFVAVEGTASFLSPMIINSMRMIKLAVNKNGSHPYDIKQSRRVLPAMGLFMLSIRAMSKNQQPPLTPIQEAL
jgi:hypothetical protein